jgi:hypothetical protein
MDYENAIKLYIGKRGHFKQGDFANEVFASQGYYDEMNIIKESNSFLLLK